MADPNMKHQVCSQCVMDTSDPVIEFDSQGVCNHCRNFASRVSQTWFPGPEGRSRLDRIVETISAAGKGKDYDCVLGLSGGIDSSYMAIKIKELGLRPLVVHVDAGWNSEVAVANIERVVRHCGYDLHTHVVDWEDMRELQLAYLRSGISNQDVPQDHIFFASLYHFAISHDIRFILSGGNIASEGIMAETWHEGSAMDSINLKAIHSKFGQRPLRSYRTISFWQYYVLYPLVRKMRTVRPLNYMPYDKAQAAVEMREVIGWRDYGRKHGESHFTKLFQNHYLPVRFGYDKRRPHLSSLIVSGQMTRDEALAELAKPLYDPVELESDITYFCKKLQIPRNDFDSLMSLPLAHHTDFPTWDGRYRMLKRVQALVERMTGRRVGVYS